jgi:hypothetical protein
VRAVHGPAEHGGSPLDAAQIDAALDAALAEAKLNWIRVIILY